MNDAANGRYYVYHLIDPRSGKVFYVGKGTGGRISHHERDARKLRFANTEKEQLIHEIWDSGMSVKRKIVKRFDCESKAYQHEKSEIFRIGHENLTNVSSGRQDEYLKSLAKASRFVTDMRERSKLLAGERKLACLSLINEMIKNIEFIHSLMEKRKCQRQ